MIIGQKVVNKQVPWLKDRLNTIKNYTGLYKNLLLILPQIGSGETSLRFFIDWLSFLKIWGNAGFFPNMSK